MSIKALQDYTYVSKYARFNTKEHRRETWVEAVDRVKEMHLRKFPMAAEDIEWAFDLSKQKRVLGSQRALQFGGKPIEQKNARMYNCCVSFCDRIRFFQESFWLLLCGCGTGFSVQKHHIANLPDFHPHRTGEVNQKPKKKKFIVPDSIEGWADSLGILLATYFPHDEFQEWEGHEVVFDFSLIRPAGSVLTSGVGKAPGPEPLRRSLEIIRGLLNDCCKKYNRLRPIDAYDIIMHASDAVLSGGVRRSATICIFSHDDQEMMKAKTGNWFTENPQRARSNNSVMLIRGETTKEQFVEIMQDVKGFGEPGFYFSDHADQLPNPCVVGDSTVTTDVGLELVSNLIGKKFSALVDGKSYCSKGFWKTGNKEILELEFSSGRSLKVTANHKIMTTNGWKEAGEIALGDSIVINNHREFNHKIDSNSKEGAIGYLLGSFLGDGNISKGSAEVKWWGDDKDEYRKEGFSILEKAELLSYNHKEESNSVATYCSLQSVKLYRLAESLDCVVKNSRRLGKKAIVGNWSYLANLIAGYFDADGTVAFNPKKGSSVRISSAQFENLQNLQIVLNAFGIYSTIYNDRREAGYRLLPDGNGGKKEYFCEAVHELVVSCDNIVRFHELIPLRNIDKRNKIETIVNSYKRLPNRTLFCDTLINKKIAGCEDVFDCTVDEIHAFDNDSVYVHNCVEIGMWPVHYATGKSGWQMCNLCEINGKKIKHKEDFALAAKAAAIIGTLQASYTNFEYLGQTTKEIVEKEALLGVSITGMMDNPDIIFDPDTQREMAQLVVDTNTWMAAKIGINPAARCTCVKPAGTTSCILGSASGIHPHHAKRYFRRIQGNYMEAPLQFFKKFNPIAVEKSVWSANKTDEVITFCVEVPDGGKFKNQLGALTLLEHVKSTQQNWVVPGKREELCTQPWLSHNVSNTINIKPDEWDEITDFIFDNRDYFAGIALLPQSGDLDYPQAPFATVYTSREIVQMYGEGSLFASGLIVDGLRAFDDNLWAACDAVLGQGELLVQPVEPIEGEILEISEYNIYKAAFIAWEMKKDFVRRAIQFANRYFEGDVKKMTYCLKCVSNCKLWQDLNREVVDVDFSQMFEATDETKPMDTVACAGGACAI